MIKFTAGTELRQNPPKNSENHVKSPKNSEKSCKIGKK